MLYLLDASAVITAKDSYFAIDQVPEFWEWLIDQGRQGIIKIPLEIFEEIGAGPEEHPFHAWRKDRATAEALLLDEEVDMVAVQQVLACYGPNLNEDEIDYIARDPFLLAYALGNPERTIVTVEASRPAAQRHKRQIPDVSADLGIPCINTFQMNRVLGWRTNWNT